MFFIIASLGMPGLGNFVGEFLILMGAFAVNKTITIFATLGLVTGAVYALIAMQKVFQGPLSKERGIRDLGMREMTAMVPMIAGLTWLGVYPQPVFDLIEPALAGLFELANITGSPWIGRVP